MKFTAIQFRVNAGVGHLTLNRGDGVNAVDRTMADEFLAATIMCDEDPEVRAVLIDATGPNFCAGGDIQGFRDKGDRLPILLKEMTTVFHAAVTRLAHSDAPVVVAAHGNVLGGGTAFVCAADLVVAAASTEFRLAYTSLGLVPDGGVTFALPRIVGLRRAKELMLLNRSFTAQEAHEWGLVTRVVDDVDLKQASIALAEELAAGPTVAFGHTRRLLNESYSTTIETQLDAESRAIASAGRTEDVREALAAFTDKRRPHFIGG